MLLRNSYHVLKYAHFLANRPQLETVVADIMGYENLFEG